MKTPIAILLIAIVPLLADEVPVKSSAFDPEKGELTESGKFVPRVEENQSAPNPGVASEFAANLSAKLAKFNIKVDQMTLRLGAVELDRKAMTVSIPATVNMLEGATEYLLVHRNGKLHESIFATDAKPEDIHLACLLAGLDPKENPPQIEIEITWETNGPPRRHRAEEVVAIAAGSPQENDGSHLDKGSWNYIGSRVDAAGFAATREGSIIALITDPAALVANPRPSRLDDTLHTPNKNLLPSVGHPVKITIRRHAEAK